MVPDPQLLADRSEGESAARYRRRQELAAVMADAIRRADAMERLELNLRHLVPVSTVEHFAN